jgi:hypothetical protein
MSCSFTALLPFLGTVCLIITSSVLLGGYLPARLFNDNAKKVTCTISTTVAQHLCRNGAITRNCYTININTRAVDWCGTVQKGMTFYDKATADAYAARNPPYTRICYYIEECNPTFYLKDVNGTFWAGIVFASLTAFFYAYLFGECMYKKCKSRRGYSELVTEIPV